MASMGNDEQACGGAMSGLEGKALRLSAPARSARSGLHARARPGPGAGLVPMLGLMLGLLLGLTGCASGPDAPVLEAPSSSRPAAPPGGPSPAAAAPRPVPGAAGAEEAAAVPLATDRPIVREGARWMPASWDELPGWSQDRLSQVWPSLMGSCTVPAPGWARTCQAARALGQPDEARLRAWLQASLVPFRVEAFDGRSEGMITGYFEPLVAASRTRRPGYTVPLHALPSGLAAGKAWYSRAEIDTLPAAQAALKGREIAWVADPLDALLLQIQGSGRLQFTEADGTRRTVRLAYAGHNDHGYQSVGRWLVERGAFTLEQASWPAIKQWARANPGRVKEMLQANPRYVFFREEPLPDPGVGPLGAQGVPLTPGRSIAVDKRSVPYGTPVWLDTTEPQPWSPTPPPPRPLQRLVMAQDTGSAIVGAVRADYFWGWAEGAEDRAGRMKQPLRMWVLWPK
jgi:membrane-bound lytic murein transglycosylase A